MLLQATPHTQSTTHTQSTAPMLPTTALLVSSSNFNWVGLRATLADWPEVRVIDDVQQREPALRIMTQEHPDLILLASDLAGLRLVPLVRDLRAASPSSRIVMLGKLLDPETHRQLTALDVAAFLQWKVVTPECLRHVLAAIRTGEVYVGCKGVIQAVYAPERRRQARGADSPVLTPKLRAVLLGLVAGRTHQEIADAEGVSVGAIDHRALVLKEAFDVPTPFMLGVMAERLGFVP